MVRASDKDYVIEEIETNAAKRKMNKGGRAALRKLTVVQLHALRDYIDAATNAAYDQGVADQEKWST